MRGQDDFGCNCSCDQERSDRLGVGAGLGSRSMENKDEARAKSHKAVEHCSEFTTGGTESFSKRVGAITHRIHGCLRRTKQEMGCLVGASSINDKSTLSFGGVGFVCCEMGWFKTYSIREKY